MKGDLSRCSVDHNAGAAVLFDCHPSSLNQIGEDHSGIWALVVPHLSSPRETL
jgi:hypothetical protein